MLRHKLRINVLVAEELQGDKRIEYNGTVYHQEKTDGPWLNWGELGNPEPFFGKTPRGIEDIADAIIEELGTCNISETQDKPYLTPRDVRALRFDIDSKYFIRDHEMDEEPMGRVSQETVYLQRTLRPEEMGALLLAVHQRLEPLYKQAKAEMK